MGPYLRKKDWLFGSGDGGLALEIRARIGTTAACLRAVLRRTRLGTYGRSQGWDFFSELLTVFVSRSISLHGKRPTKNWSGQGESDCLIKTKHRDGPERL